MEKRILGPVTGASTLGASIGLIITWILNMAGVDVPTPIEYAIVVILTAIGGYLVKPGTGKRVDK